MSWSRQWNKNAPARDHWDRLRGPRALPAAAVRKATSAGRPRMRLAATPAPRGLRALPWMPASGFGHGRGVPWALRRVKAGAVGALGGQAAWSAFSSSLQASARRSQDSAQIRQCSYSSARLRQCSAQLRQTCSQAVSR